MQQLFGITYAINSPMDVKHPDPIRHRLPLLRNFEQAEALAIQEQDPFYLAAFLIQCWLGELVMRGAAQYAENKNPKDRLFQTGESWRTLVEFFNLKPEKPCGYLLSCFYRFSALDDSPGNSLRRSLTPLVIERRVTGEHAASTEAREVEAGKKGRLRLRLGLRLGKKQGGGNDAGPSTLDSSHRTLVRWCSWLDAEIHLRTHRRWHESPACFDPDPETRHLAALGNAQRHLAKLDDHAKACWLADFTTAAEHYQNSPKWSALGQAMADNCDRLWQYPDVDTLVIALWPLVKAYNWTYRDLLNVIRPGLSRRSPAKAGRSTINNQLSTPAYPCGSEQEFAAYCANALALRKKSKGASAENGEPKGSEIAREWCPALARRK